MSFEPPRNVEWPRRAVGWAAVAALVAITLHVLGFVAQVLLFAFGGVVLGVFLDGLARAVAKRTPLGRGASVAVVLGVIVALAAGALVLLVPRFASEARQLVRALPGAFEDARAAIADSPIAGVIPEIPPKEQLVSKLDVVIERAGPLLGGVFGALGGIVLLSFVGLVFAIQPEAYTAPVLRLVPMERRARWREVFGVVREKLFFWVIGRLVNMLIIGTFTTIGLAVLGVPAPVALGVIAGALTFVPNIGPLASFVPAALLAMTKGPTTLLWVALLYAASQGIESYVVTPLVQRRAAAVPPALLLTAQIALGVPLGALGLLFATPLVAIAIVLTRAFYVEDRLGDRGAEATA